MLGAKVTIDTHGIEPGRDSESMTVALSGSQRGNVIGSLLATGSGFFLVFVLPPVLVRDLGVRRYASWALAAEFAGYASLFEVGTALGVAAIVAANGHLSPRELGRTLRAISWALAAVAAVFLVVTGTALAALVGAGHGDAGLTRTLVIVLGLPSICDVATSYAYGILIGRGEILRAGISIFAGRAVAAALVLAALSANATPVETAVLWALPSCAGYVLLVPLSHRGAAGASISHEVGSALRREGWKFSGGFAVWAAAGFLVIGLDTTIVAGWDLRAVSAYAFAASFALLVQAALSALLAPMIPRVRRLVNTGRTDLAQSEVLGLTRLAGLVAVFACALLATDGTRVISIFAGIHDRRAGLVLGVLLAAAAFRLTLLPVGNAVFALGEHTRNWWIPLIEGGTNLVASIALAPSFGALGVACGTLIGGLTGVLVALVLIRRRMGILILPGVRDLRSMYASIAIAVLLTVALNWRLGLSPVSTTTEVALVLGNAALSVSLLGPLVARHYRPRVRLLTSRPTML